ncbi:acetyl-CoA synthetase-like protein [Anaeromyces robustus]|uniref:Acetyl-CoA synthetase-like protein n=1 Tax=Anaeromyces robustus TaxID=1754192 RepID=A0A1Y1WT93_9FUNG|nr:acetyl-CoA synthetase-like protein [Anaeromyces robustus]|eukprot:ORX76770.1 acetyl-CoA synthetase-like protein [Anaeromyces robustus]
MTIEHKNKTVDLLNENEQIMKEFPLTSQQLSIYVNSIKNSNDISNNLSISLNLKENINIDKLKKGFIELFNNQEILKSKFIEREKNGKTEVVGLIDNDCILEFENYTYENFNSFVKPFNLNKAPLIRVGFINNEKLLIDIHNIISDEFSFSIIERELNNFYYINDINYLDSQFSDYAIQLNNEKNQENFEKQKSFYIKMFKENYEILNIPKKDIKNVKENNNNNINNNNNNIQTSKKIIDKATTSSINKYIKSHNINKITFFVTVYGFIMSKYSGQDKVYTSLNLNRNNNNDLNNMIGLFNNIQPILLNYDNRKEKFLNIIQKNMENISNILDNKNISFETLSKMLKLKNINNNFVYISKITSNEEIINKNNLSIFSNEKSENEVILSNNQNNNKTKFDITFYVIEKDNNYIVKLKYNENIYDSKMINNIMNSFLEVIENYENFDKNIEDIEYISKEDKEKIIYKFNDNDFHFDCNQLCHVEFSKISKQFKDKDAIICNDNVISFGELDEMTNSLAHYLRSQNIGKKDIIPIITERSNYFVIAVIAVMKSGATYLPIDPEFPKDRIEYMLNEVNAKLILKYISNPKIDNKLESESFKNIMIYPLENHNYKENIHDINNINEGSDICYVLFTSGTTGKPKGTLITHYNMSNFCIYSQNFNKTEDIYGKDFDNALAFSKFTFDMSLIEIFYPLLRGSRVIISNEEEFTDPKLLSKLIKKYDIKYICSVPSRIENYMKDLDFKESIKNVKWLGFGGEKLDYKTIENIQNNSDVTNIINYYGPTEGTVCCTLKLFESRRNKNNGNENENENGSNQNRCITIGKPLCNYKIYILDKCLKPVPIDVVGEICIGGYGVGKGYLHREELTNEKFVDCPYYSIDGIPSKMYRTGDLGKWTNDGEVICLGREDFQVKIHGQRIELGEIENTIKSMNEIENAIVIDFTNETTSNKYLVCYFITEKDIDGKNIRNYLNDKLPLYMIPNYFIKIEKIPLTSNGKLDRKALPEPNPNDQFKEKYIAPETEIEKTICKIYSKLFNVKENEIGRMSNFYELGGDSFNAINTVVEINKTINISLNIKDILNNLTVKDLASLIQSKLNKNEKMDTTTNISIKKNNCTEFTITSLLSGLPYNYNTFDLEFYKKFSCNMFQGYRIKNGNELDVEKLTKAFIKIIERHEILRCNFIEKTPSTTTVTTTTTSNDNNDNNKKHKKGFFEKMVHAITKLLKNQKKPKSSSSSSSTLSLYNKYIYNNVYCKVKNIEDIKLEIEQYTIENFLDFVRPFDISKDLMIRVGLIDKSVLMIDIDHRIADGYSLEIIIRDLNKIYNNEILEEVPIKYSDYAIHYDNQLRNNSITNQLNYYKNMFNATFQPVTLDKSITDHTPKFVEINKLKVLRATTDKETHSIINKICREYGVSKTAIFITIYCLILSIYSDEENVFMTIVGSNRSNSLTDNLVGLLLRYIPILVKIEKEISLIDLIKKVMDILLTTFEHYNIPYSLLKEELNLPSHNILFKFDPYGMSYFDDNKEFDQYLGAIDIFKHYKRLDLIRKSMLKIKQANSGVNDFFTYNNTPEISLFVAETKENYNILLTYIADLYNEKMMNEVLNNLLNVLKNENYYKSNINTIINDYHLKKYYNENEN